jgi:hypothetical protein
MKRLALIFAATAALGVWPAASNAATFKGVVVAHQRGALLVASSAGVVRAVPGSASIGARVVLSGGHATVVGRAHTAHVRGIVVRRIGTTVFLSSNRHLVAVHTGRRLASASDTTVPAPSTPAIPPATLSPGDVVSSQVTIKNGELDEDSSENLGSSGASSLQVQATVASIGAGTVTLTVGTQTLTVPLPAGLTLPASLVGQTVTLSLSLNGNNANGDDDNEDDSGDDNGGNSGHGGGGDG